MVLTVIGFNHRTASLAEREPFQLQRRDLAESILDFKRISGMQETVIVVTCNRVEFYCANPVKGRPGSSVAEFYRQRGVDRPERVLDFAYRHVGAGAARHLFRVASGMDSLVLGEEQIRGQVKDAYSAACSVGGAGKVLHKLFHFAFRVSKRVRNETPLGEGVRSIPGVAVQQLMEGVDGDARAVVIGADETTDVILCHLSRLGVETILVNRTLPAAQKMAKAYGAVAVPWERLADEIAASTLVFSATGAPSTVLEPAMIGDRTARPLRIADLAVPRDVDREVATLPGVDLVDLEDLKFLLERVAGQRCLHLPEAQGIVEEGVDAFLEWLHAQSFAGGIDAVKHEMHEAANEELQRFRSGFHESEVKALEAFSHALIKRFIKSAAHHFEPEGYTPDQQTLRQDPAAIEEAPASGGQTGASESDPPTLSCRERRALRESDEEAS